MVARKVGHVQTPQSIAHKVQSINKIWREKYEKMREKEYEFWRESECKNWRERFQRTSYRQLGAGGLLEYYC
jgi:hypothetical protein